MSLWQLVTERHKQLSWASLTHSVTLFPASLERNFGAALEMESRWPNQVLLPPFTPIVQYVPGDHQADKRRAREPDDTQGGVTQNLRLCARDNY